MPNPTITVALDQSYSRYAQNPSLYEEELFSAIYTYAETMLGVKRGEENGSRVVSFGDEDALQEATAKIWRQLPRYDVSRAKFSTWAYRIVKTTEIDHANKKHRKEPPDILDLEVLKNETSHEIAVDTQYQIKEAIEKLPAEEKALVNQVRLGDTVAQAAKELGISRATAFRRWKSAQALLQGKLE